MKWEDFERFVDPVILERGLAYRENGRITDLEETASGIYHADVAGSEPYEVVVKLGSRGEVAASCDCPYEEGICKHAVAVLLEIRDMLDSGEFQTVAGPAAAPDWRNRLKELSKDELIGLMERLAGESKETARLLAAAVAEPDTKEGLAAYKKLIRSSIKQHADRYGFVSYRNVSHAVAGAENVLAKAEDAFERRNDSQAVRIVFCVLHEMSDLLQACDDSDGIVGGLIQYGLDMAAEASSRAEDMPKNERKALFRLLLGEARHPSFKGWGDWQLSVLESASAAMDGSSEREEWNAALEAFELQERNGSGHYYAERTAELRYRVIGRLDGDEAAEAYMEASLHIPALREAAIERAIRDERFDRALRLAEEGERTDKLPGIIDDWRKLRYRVYELTNRKAEQIELAFAFAADGEYDYYARLKQLYSADAWPEAFGRLLERLEAGSRSWSADELYTRLLVEEKLTDELLVYVRKHPSRIEEFAKHLIGGHEEETLAVYRQQILDEMARAGNRKAYYRVCQIIKRFRKLGGAERTTELVGRLRGAYPKRSAMLEELSKIG